MEATYSFLLELPNCQAVYRDSPDGSKIIVSLTGLSPPSSSPSEVHKRTYPRRDGWGRYLDHEWGYYADWYDANRPWRPYIPVPARLPYGSWLFGYYGTTDPGLCEAEEAKGRDRVMWRRMHRAERAELLDISRIVQAKYPGCLPAPTLNECSWEDAVSLSDDLLLSKLWDERRCLLDVLGHSLYYLINDKKGWNTTVPELALYASLVRWIESPKRGAFLSNENLRKELVAELLEHRVPTFYEWSKSSLLANSPYDPVHIGAREFKNFKAERELSRSKKGKQKSAPKKKPKSKKNKKQQLPVLNFDAWEEDDYDEDDGDDDDDDPSYAEACAALRTQGPLQANTVLDSNVATPLPEKVIEEDAISMGDEDEDAQADPGNDAMDVDGRQPAPSVPPAALVAGRADPRGPVEPRYLPRDSASDRHWRPPLPSTSSQRHSRYSSPPFRRDYDRLPRYDRRRSPPRESFWLRPRERSPFSSSSSSFRNSLYDPSQDRESSNRPRPYRPPASPPRMMGSDRRYVERSRSPSDQWTASSKRARSPSVPRYRRTERLDSPPRRASRQRTPEPLNDVPVSGSSSNEEGRREGPKKKKKKKSKRKPKAQLDAEESELIQKPRDIVPKVYPDRPPPAPLPKETPRWHELKVPEACQSLLDRLSTPEGHPLWRPFRSPVPFNPSLSLPLESNASLMTRLGLHDASADVPELLTRIKGYESKKTEITRQQLLQWLDAISRDWKQPLGSAETKLLHKMPELPDISVEGVLTMSKRTELRVRYWLLQRPELNIREMIPDLLRHGMEFEVRIPAEKIPSIMKMYLGDCGNEPNYGILGQIPYGPDLVKMANQYDERVKHVLLRSNAIRAYTKGGLLWRIAVHYAPSASIAKVLQGPSDSVRGWLQGQVSGGSIGDRLSDDEIDAILGQTSNSCTVWPPLDLWNESDHWEGDWSKSNESWFQSRLKVIAQKAPRTFLSRRGWKSDLSRHSRQEIEGHDVDGSENQAEWLCNVMTEDWPILFEGRDLVNI